MNKQQLDTLLNTACEIIGELESFADPELQIKIDAFFNEIKYSDSLDADMEAQDWDVFGDSKI